MKTLVIVSTEIKQGRGGIQSALRAYCDGLTSLKVKYIHIDTHSDSDRFFLRWLLGAIQIIKLAFRYRGGKAVFWFHCGPWLSLFRKFTLAWIPRLTGCTTLAHIHSYSVNRYLQFWSGRTFVKLMLLPYSRLIVLTPWWEHRLRQYGVTKDTLVSPNPVGQASIEVASKMLNKVQTDEKVANVVKLLAMGRLIRGKGFEKVLTALALLPEKFILTVAGDGEQKDDLIALSKQLKLDTRVNFVGWVEGVKKDQLMKEADIFCLPSENDAFGMIFIEAMAYDLPIVALDFSPVNQVVSAKEGVLCKDNSAETLKSAIEKISNEKASYAGAGPDKVLGEFSPLKAARYISRLLND